MDAYTVNPSQVTKIVQLKPSMESIPKLRCNGCASVTSHKIGVIDRESDQITFKTGLFPRRARWISSMSLLETEPPSS